MRLRKDVMDFGPVLGLIVMLGVCIAICAGCALKLDLATHEQDRARSRDRVLIDRAHGSYEGDRALTMDERITRRRAIMAGTADAE